MNEERGLLLGVFFCYYFWRLLPSGSSSSFFGVAISHVRRLLRLYFASDTLFLVIFHFGVFFFLFGYFDTFTVESFSVFVCFFFFFLFDNESFALVPMHTEGTRG